MHGINLRRGRLLLVLAIPMVLAPVIALSVARAAHGAPAADVRYRLAGYAEVANGQTALLSVANVATTTCTADLLLVNTLNQVVKEADNVSIAPGMGTMITYADTAKGRKRLRMEVVSIGDSCSAFHGTMEVYGTASKVTTEVVQYGNPEG
jgi:hypothetical protein